MKMILALTSLSAFCALAYGGPEQYSGKEIPQVAPPPVASFSWTGFYGGAFGGYKYADTDLSLDMEGLWRGGPAEAGLEPAGSDDLDTSGAEAGGLFGYNYQWDNWVIGAEVAAGYLWLRDSNEEDVRLCPTCTPVVLRDSFKTRYLVTVAPRVGYAFHRWLPYVTGGLAVGDVDFFQKFVVDFPEGGDIQETRVGWMVGGGLQYAFTEHWSARAQYEYVDLGCADFDSEFAGIFTAHHEICLREHNASFALIYKF